MFTLSLTDHRNGKSSLFLELVIFLLRKIRVCFLLAHIPWTGAQMNSTASVSYTGQWPCEKDGWDNAENVQMSGTVLQKGLAIFFIAGLPETWGLRTTQTTRASQSTCTMSFGNLSVYAAHDFEKGVPHTMLSLNSFLFSAWCVPFFPLTPPCVRAIRWDNVSVEYTLQSDILRSAVDELLQNH